MQISFKQNKKKHREHFDNTMCTYVLHFLGSVYPSRPGFTGMLFSVFLQLLHWIVSRVALALMADAAIIIPGILTSFAICADWKSSFQLNSKIYREDA